MRKKLTSRFVETVAAPRSRRVEYHDELLPGLRLRVFSTGRRSWSVVARVNGRQVRHGLGIYPIVGLSEARDAGRAVLQDIQLGRYASQQEVTPPALQTLGEVVPEFTEKHARPKNRDWRATASMLRRFEPLFHMPLAEIKRSDVVRILDGIVAEGKPYRRRSSASAPLPVSASANSATIERPSASAKRATAALCASIPSPERR